MSPSVTRRRADSARRVTTTPNPRHQRERDERLRHRLRARERQRDGPRGHQLAEERRKPQRRRAQPRPRMRQRIEVRHGPLDSVTERLPRGEVQPARGEHRERGPHARAKRTHARDELVRDRAAREGDAVLARHHRREGEPRNTRIMLERRYFAAGHHAHREHPEDAREQRRAVGEPRRRHRERRAHREQRERHERVAPREHRAHPPPRSSEERREPRERVRVRTHRAAAEERAIEREREARERTPRRDVKLRPHPPGEGPAVEERAVFRGRRANEVVEVPRRAMDGICPLDHRALIPVVGDALDREDAKPQRHPEGDERGGGES